MDTGVMDTGGKSTIDHDRPDSPDSLDSPDSPDSLDSSNNLVIRRESADGTDNSAIHALTTMAFHGAEHSSGTEAAIIDALRGAGALTVSLVAVRAGRIIGHIAASPVVLDPPDSGTWYGLGPLSVHPEFQGQGIGSALIRAVLDRIGSRGVDSDSAHGGNDGNSGVNSGRANNGNNAAGAVLLGEPDFYSRFGFAARDDLIMGGLPPENAPYFQALRLGTPAGERKDAGYPHATVTYHPAFDATV